MSRSATPATQNEATRSLKPTRSTQSAKLTIGTAIRQSRERLRTVANVNATSSEHTLSPQTPRVKREPLLCIREKSDRIPNFRTIFQDILHQLKTVVYPIIHRVSTIRLVAQDFATIHSTFSINVHHLLRVSQFFTG